MKIQLTVHFNAKLVEHQVITVFHVKLAISRQVLENVSIHVTRDFTPIHLIKNALNANLFAKHVKVPIRALHAETIF